MKIARAQDGVVGLAGRRQHVERQHADHALRIVEVDEVAGVALLVVRIAGALGAVELAAEHGDLRDDFGLAHEGGNLLGQDLGADAARELMPGRAPAERRTGREQEQDGQQAAKARAHGRSA